LFIVAAETLGFESYAPPYLSPQASGKNLLTGANFASAASSYYDDTAAMYVSTTSSFRCCCFNLLRLASCYI
jgi:hypothetical protein